MKHYIGIDPGAGGSMCIIKPNGTIQFVDFKTTKLESYISLLKQLLPKLKNNPLAIEAVSSMPGQGVKSMFSFGQRLGELEGMLQTLHLGYIKVRPREWQGTAGVVPKSGKKGVYEAMHKIYPSAELMGPKGGIMDGRCDALGIAHYMKLKG